MTTLPATLLALTGTFSSASGSNLLGAAIAVGTLLVSIRQFFIQLDRVQKTAYDPELGADRAQKFHHRQALRRVQLSTLVGIFAVLMLLGLYIPAHEYPRAWGLVWIAALGFLLWGGAIALVDVVSIRLFYSGEIDQQYADKLVLDYKMKKFQEEHLRELDAAQKQAEKELQEERQDKEVPKASKKQESR